MLDKIIKTIRSEVLEEVGEEITDHFFGAFKDIAFAAGIVIMMLLIYFIYVGISHTFG